MTAAAITTFWIGVLLLCFIWIGYPALIVVRALFLRRPFRTGPEQPFVSVIIAAHNEESVIRAKLANTTGLDYPANRMEVIVASDGSDDGTNAAVKGFDHPSVILLALDRVGKSEALNTAVSSARGDILLFTDADSMLNSHALTRLVEPFADNTVGGVAGDFYYEGKKGTNIGEHVHWNFDRLLKAMQSVSGSITSATGQVYAIRKELFRRIPRGVSDDFFVSASTVRSGHRLVFASGAVAAGMGIDLMEMEFRRKRRVFTIGFCGVWALKSLCNPVRYGFYAVQVLTQKILRRLYMAPVAAIFISNMAILPSGNPLFRNLFAIQCVFHGLAIAGWVLRKTRLGRTRLMTLPCTFDAVGIAGLYSLFDSLRKSEGDAWTPLRPASGTPVQTSPKEGPVEHGTIQEAGRTIAYCFSRFPAITETFVLNEILWLRRHGVRVEVFPLTLKKVTVMHDGAREIAGSVHCRRLLSRDVIAAQFHWITRRPLSYAGCWLRATLGNITSARFLGRSFFVIPMAAFFARKMMGLNVTHIHVHFATHAALAAWCVNRLTGIPYSITVHSGDIFATRCMLKEKILASEATVAISEFNRTFLTGLYGPEVAAKLRVIRCGVDRSLLDSIPRRKKQLRIPLIACVASFDYYKGHRYLVEACLELKRRGIRFLCICIGHGQDFEYIRRRLIEYRLREVRLAGAQPHHKVLSLLSRASLSVLPSIVMDSGKTEGIPVALMESLAMRVPVIASDLSGIPELIESGKRGGILVPQKDPVRLADAMAELLQNRPFAEMLAEEGRRVVDESYDLDANMRKKMSLLLDRTVHTTN